jgi:pyruvyl transferase EpsO
LGGAKRVGLINFPNHGNPGDPLIWLGTEALLVKLGVELIYRSAWWDFDPTAAKEALGGNSPLLINGGGNLGDLYQGQQGARVKALIEMHGTRLIQMPQSIHFRDPANASAFGKLCRQHGDFQLIVRERKSAKVARDLLGINPLLSPDHAIASKRPMLDKIVPTKDFLWLARKPGDPEYVETWVPEADNLARIEWLEGVTENEGNWDAFGQMALSVNRGIKQMWNPRATWASDAHNLAAATYDPLAERWIYRGYEILRSARVVITDKLHGHLMCVLADIPHVVLDNSYGKVSGTLDTWTGQLPGVHRAGSGEEAWAIAQRVLMSLNG